MWKTLKPSLPGLLGREGSLATAAWISSISCCKSSSTRASTHLNALFKYPLRYELHVSEISKMNNIFFHIYHFILNHIILNHIILYHIILSYIILHYTIILVSYFMMFFYVFGAWITTTEEQSDSQGGPWRRSAEAFTARRSEAFQASKLQSSAFKRTE